MARINNFRLGFRDGAKSLSLDLEHDIKMNLFGKIDRVDFSEDGQYFLVIDYKTGRKYINLIDVYCGLSLQLLTYLFVANKYLADKIPAGMLYCLIMYPPKANFKEVSEEKAKEIIENELKMPGWVLADEEVIKKIDENQKFIKVKLTTKGTINEKTAMHAKTAEQFNILLNYVAKTINNAGNRIINGDISVNPYKTMKSLKKTACDYCPYKAVCGFELSGTNMNWRNIPDLNPNQIFDLMKNDNKQ